MWRKLQNGWVESHLAVKKKMKVKLELQHAVLGLEKEVMIQEECKDNGTPESGKKESPNVRFGVKRTINSPVSSPVTMKKLLPLKKMKTREIKRRPAGIKKKADFKILTSTPCRKVTEENHEKKTIKRKKKSETAKKIEVFKKEVAQTEREEKKARTQPARKVHRVRRKLVKKQVKKKKVTQVWEKAKEYKENT